MTDQATFTRDASFGWDPWPNETTRPSQDTTDHSAKLASLLSSGALYVGADTIGGDIDQLPRGLNMYGSYVDNFGGYVQLVDRFGKDFDGLLLSITIFGHIARCADCEPGAMNVGDLPHWLDNITVKDSQLPWVYTSASNMGAVNAAIGNRKVIRWSAHYGWGPHICGPNTCGFPQADWTQWDNKGAHGENIDRSLGSVLPHPAAPPRQHPTGTASFAGSLNSETGRWTIHGAPGTFKTGTKGGKAAAYITFDESNGVWTISSEPWARKPKATLDGKIAVRAEPSGTANFEGSFISDAGQWTIKGVHGDFQPGTKGGKAAAQITFDETNGHWTIEGKPWKRNPLKAVWDFITGR